MSTQEKPPEGECQHNGEGGGCPQCNPRGPVWEKNQSTNFEYLESIRNKTVDAYEGGYHAAMNSKSVTCLREENESLRRERDNARIDLQHALKERDEWRDIVKGHDAECEMHSETNRLLCEKMERAFSERDALKAENAKLQAQLYVAKDSALRTYDGLSERAALADKWRNDLDEAIAALESIKEHQEHLIPQLPRVSTTWRIAADALAKLRGREGKSE